MYSTCTAGLISEPVYAYLAVVLLGNVTFANAVLLIVIVIGVEFPLWSTILVVPCTCLL